VAQIGNLRRKNSIWIKTQNGPLFKDQRIKMLQNYRFSNGFLSPQKLSR
jgi:hypothetical protein